jgi:hypothetical protein
VVELDEPELDGVDGRLKLLELELLPLDFDDVNAVDGDELLGRLELEGQRLL